MALSDVLIRTAKATDKVLKLFDGGGLFLQVTPAGGKWWRLKYRFAGKEKLISLGTYPDTSLKEARERRDAARKLLEAGVDPGEERKAVKTAAIENAANTFEAVTREWFAKFGPAMSRGHAVRVMRMFERDIFPWIGGKPIAELATQPCEVLQVLRRIEDRGAIETAHRARSKCSEVFLYAIPTGRADRDPCADLRKAIPPADEKNLAAITEPDKVGALLRAMDGYNGGLIVRCALRLAPLVFVRPGELRHAEWKDIDLEAAEWKYLVTKTKTPHIVPLSRQAVDILRELHPVTGTGRYVFPSPLSVDRPMSDNAILTALRRMGIPKDEMCGHGFRAMARTLLDEVLHFPADIIEHQLAHKVKDPLGRAYNRTTKLDDRRRMMQEWADYLDGLKTGNIRLGKVA
ncbi:MAG TPA: integrase arm-type DNA-binding domain-containing protein [Candidatus Ozemobacteraceae bacterium]|nr:integrase arm-type DNA-binding domain-containing protein [Candidatus Ozemobacteraceae bacterium]